jgi:hypothetical protein
MDMIKAMGGTNVPANFAWIDIEPRPGEFHWQYADHQVEQARRRGLEIFAYTGLTPDWALPPVAPKQPGMGYRFPPDEKYVPEFQRFFTTLARRYRGRVKYYEFWNEPNGCGWINDNGANGHMAHTYVPWLRRWYEAMKQGDPDCVLAIGGLDYHEGVKEGWRYLEDIYKCGGAAYFDAVAIHPYGDPLNWQAIRDIYLTLVRHGDGHKKLWINEYGWNTRDEAAKSRNLRRVLRELARPEYHMVFQASYLVLTDLPDTDDREGHDYGLCSRDREKLTITPRESYWAFSSVAKQQSLEPAKRNKKGKAGVSGQSCVPASKSKRGSVPKGFMLYFAAPGVEPGQPGDDQGPPMAVRRQFIHKGGANVGEFSISWAQTEPQDPGDGPSTYDFSACRPDQYVLRQPFIICHLNFMGNPWADKLWFKDKARYMRLLERWACAACRFARNKFGAKLFETGGNERDLVDPAVYKPYYPDWHFFYMDPIKAIHRGMKRANRDNRLIIGNLCYSDRDHVGALYAAGAKGNFEVLAIHAYGPRGCHVDMEQVIESHEEMEFRGDGNIPILVTEGWSCFPLPESLDRDPAWRSGERAYKPQEIEHYRQAVLDGWRNLITARPGMYDPSWVCGARYFVLNDHWGGRGWAARAKPEYDDQGNLKGFHLDGYWIATRDPDFVKPFLRPWGLIDIHGRPKGDVIAFFPPYIPRHHFTATVKEPLEIVSYDPRHPERTCPEVIVGKPYHVSVEFVNLEDSPMSQCHFRLSEKNEADFPGGYGFVFQDGVLEVFTDPTAERLVRATLLEPPPPTQVGPGEAVRLRYEVIFAPAAASRRDDGKRERVRPYVDLYCVWEGRPYHFDAWLPRLTATIRQNQGVP